MDILQFKFLPFQRSASVEPKHAHFSLRRHRRRAITVKRTNPILPIQPCHPSKMIHQKAAAAAGKTLFMATPSNSSLGRCLELQKTWSTSTRGWMISNSYMPTTMFRHLGEEQTNHQLLLANALPICVPISTLRTSSRPPKLPARLPSTSPTTSASSSISTRRRLSYSTKSSASNWMI